MAGGLYGTSVFGIRLKNFYWFILLSSVWVIYTIDHILDSKNNKNEKYTFFIQNKKYLIFVICIFLLINTYMIFRKLESDIIAFGFLSSFFVLIYLIFQHFYNEKAKHFFQKELIISIIYTSALFVPPAIVNGDILTFQAFACISYFFVVLANVCLYSLIDYAEDTELKKNSVVTLYGKKTSLYIIYISISLSAIFSIALIFMNKPLFGVLNLIMSTGLLVLTINLLKNNTKSETIGRIADALFIIPFLIFLLSG